MMTTRPPVSSGDEWMDPAEAKARAERHAEHAGKLSALADAGRRWFDAVGEANHFADRWDRITGREAS